MLKTFEDIGYTVICEKNVNSDHGYDSVTGINFTVYENDTIGPLSGMPYDNANELFQVFIKWDGCSNWVMDNFHFCGLQEIRNFSILLNRLCDLAQEVMPDNDLE